MARRASEKKPRATDRLNSQSLLGSLFKSEEEMAESLEALVDFINRRYLRATPGLRTSVLGFALQRVAIVFSSSIEGVEVETDFASDTARVFVPTIANESPEDQRARALATLDSLLPALKETHLRAAGHLYHFLDAQARQRMVEDYRRRKGES